MMTFFRLLWIGIFLTKSVQGLDDGDLGKAFLVRLSLRGSTCTASIIGDNWLITAGHCIEDLFRQSDKYDITRRTKYGDNQVYISDSPYHTDEYYAEKVSILPTSFGSNWTRPLANVPLNASAPDGTRGKNYWRRIESIIMHKNYTTESLTWQGYDIALIHLEGKNGKVVPDGKMMPACLPTNEFDDENNETLFSAGYGWRRIPHCLTNTEGPEKFQTCGREFECTKHHRTRYCPLNFTDQEGGSHNKCITDIPSPSAASSQCENLHRLRPDLKNITVHLFSANRVFKKTCFSSFSNNNGQKGWCGTRQPGVFVNGFPTEDSGWGFCSSDDSQDQCNQLSMESKEDDTPYPVRFLQGQNCFLELKKNLEVEQPEEVNDKFQKVVDDSDTFCVGQFHNHSFENEEFVSFSKGAYHDLAKTSYLKNQIFEKSNAQRTYFDGGPGCFGDSGGPLWREVYDSQSHQKVPVLVGVFSYLLWGTCHGSHSPKYYGRVVPITDWIKQYVAQNQMCEFSDVLKDNRPKTPLECKMGAWGEWMPDFTSSRAYINPDPQYVSQDMAEVEFVEYGSTDNDSYTYEDYEYDSEYNVEEWGFPPILTNCTCVRKDIQYEQQSRRNEIVIEGSIGGTPCLFSRQTRDCKCPDYVVPTCPGQQPKCCKSTWNERFCVAKIIRTDCPLNCQNYTTSTATPLSTSTTPPKDTHNHHNGEFNETFHQERNSGTDVKPGMFDKLVTYLYAILSKDKRR